MKRTAVIVSLAFLMVFMTTGAAFAAACGGNECPEAMVCAPRAAEACPMTDGLTMQHSTCDHGVQAQSHEAVTVDSAHAPAALPVSTYAIRPAFALRGLSRSPFAPDARGAPHLSAVMRN